MDNKSSRDSQVIGVARCLTNSTHCALVLLRISVFHQHSIPKAPEKLTVRRHFFLLWFTNRNVQCGKKQTRTNTWGILEHLKVLSSTCRRKPRNVKTLPRYRQLLHFKNKMSELPGSFSYHGITVLSTKAHTSRCRYNPRSQWNSKSTMGMACGCPTWARWFYSWT